MLEIILIRNAPGEGEGLTEEVRQQCLRAGEVLEKLYYRPDLIVSSDAPRSKDTGTYIAQGLRMPPPPIIVIPELRYFARDKETFVAEILPMLQEFGDDQPTSMYLEHDKKGVLLAHAKQIAVKIRREVERRFSQRRTLVLATGHHFIPNLVGLSLVPGNSICLGPHFTPLSGCRIDEYELVYKVDLNTEQ